MFCKTAVLKDAIAMAGVEEKQAKVDELRAAILAGNAEAEGLDATNPERQRMMEAWCQSDDPARTADKKSAFMCAKAKAKSEFYKRREVRASRIYLFIYCLTSSACACVYTGAAGLLVRRAGPRGLAQMQADGVWQAHVADG